MHASSLFDVNICLEWHFNNTLTHWPLGYVAAINPSHKYPKATGKYPTMHHFVTEMCTCVHISVTKWCIVGYETGALWDLHNRSISNVKTQNAELWLWHSLWNCTQVNATELHWWEVNIGSGNGLVLSGNKLLLKPMLIQVYVSIWCKWVDAYGHNELTSVVAKISNEWGKFQLL